MRFSYHCPECRRDYELAPELMLCPHCSERQEPDQPLRGVLEVRLEGRLEDGFDPWRLLPVPRQFFPPIPVGNTPLWEPANLRRRLGLAELYIKDDGANPTGSLKDRASFLVSAFARQHGRRQIVLASTGNAGSSMAGVGAAAGQEVVLFLPKDAPKAKLIQALQYGATVHRVDGNYDLAYELSLEYSRRFGGMNRNTAYNPMTLEGKKTVALEVFAQLGGRAPEHVFVAVGDGCILSGVYKGFRDLLALGLIDRLPVVHAVQAEGSNALFRAFHEGRFGPRPAGTVADSICVEVPRNGRHALAQLKQHGGRVWAVSDQEILEAQALLSRSSGLFTEPAGAAALAGLMRAAADLPPSATIVVLATGNGLKDTAAAGRLVAVPERVIASLDELEL